MRISDWSSDVCSSDLVGVAAVPAAHGAGGERQFGVHHHARGIEELRDAQAVAAAACADGGVEGEQARLQLRQRVFAYRAAVLRREQHRLGGRVVDRLHGRHAVAELERGLRSEEHTSELQSLMRISYAVFCLKKTTHNQTPRQKI